ncbi:MAG: DUF58 domain-containing protein [Clostridia bacterium]|nr:DUF58 domain-containing protein [Clostridia bacterium]
MKQKAGKRFRPQKRGFRVTGYALIWVLLFAVAVVFTQALRNSVSYVFMIAVLLLPPLDLFYGLIARSSVAVDFSCDKSTAEKSEPVSFMIRVKNRSILPLPFTEAELTTPDASALDSRDANVVMSIAPLSSFVYSRTVSFPYKGEYSCGVKNVYVSSLLRFFRFKMPIGQRSSVTVLPRRITVDDIPERYINETASQTSSPFFGNDSAEIAEIKGYLPGDPMRNIHWKLSTKAQELMTKHFGSESGLNTCVIADHGAHYTVCEGMRPDINEYCDDAVCEICCFAVTSGLSKGRRTSLICSDSRGGPATVSNKVFEFPESFEEYLPFYAACRADVPTDAAVLLRYPEDGADNDIVFVTVSLSAETVSALCATPADNRTATLLLFCPYSALPDPESAERENEKYIYELISANVSVRVISEKELYER